MTRNDVQHGVHQSWQFLETVDLAETLSKVDPLSVDEELRKLASSPATYDAIYMKCLEKAYFNMSLSDFSFFQYGWSAENEVRYAFYPNPFLAGELRHSQIRAYRELVDADLMSQEDYLSLLRGKESPDIRMPLIRYENSPEQRRGLPHPCSHLHIGHHGDNRWPLSRVLTPLAFTMWVVKQYYGERWRVFADEGDPLGNSLEGALIEERSNCRVIGDELFDVNERRSFSFG